MRIKLDENLPRALAALFRAAGHDAPSVLDQNLGGTLDPDLWRIVQDEERLLVTADKGFADVRIHPPGTHHGVVLLRPDRDGVQALLELGELLLNRFDLSACARTTTVVTPRGVRIRRPGSSFSP